jgi:hypothetical protein
MKQEYVTIPLAECERMIRYLTRAEYYCAHARSSHGPDVDVVNDDPTLYYPGASGYAGATMRDVLQTLESHLDS